MQDNLPPPRIYKYATANQRTLDNISKKIIYFQDPLHFNDPYDCELTMKIRELTSEDQRKLDQYNSTRKTPENPKEKEPYLLKDITQIMGHVRGVCCFSSVNDDILMWSHYGDMHKGIVLEYNTVHDPFKWARAVNYVVEYRSFDLLKYIFDEIDLEEYVSPAYIKAKQWEYEKEWRILREISGTYEYSESALTGVYFGARSSPDTEKAVRSLVGSSTELHRMHTSKTGFEPGPTHLNNGISLE